MKIVISPAKSLDFDNCPEIENTTQPVFLGNSEKLIKKLQKLSPKKIEALMSVSPALSDLNYQRYQNFCTPFTNDNAKPAGLVFIGEVYRALDARSFSKKELDVAQDKLRILSGLYGLLRPLDLVQPYRLEMGTPLAITPKMTNLYKFWGDSITNELNKEMAEDDGVLVNLASNEYFKAVNTKKIMGQLITCNFKENKGGVYKPIMTFAKQARGFMTRFIIQNEIGKIQDLKAFDSEGYVFNTGLSSNEEFIFTRG